VVRFAPVTIAACYLSSEGVVFGSDSTTTMYVAGPGPAANGAEHHFNFAQKTFEIGRESTLGITMWGLGSLDQVSYRTLIARFADLLTHHPAPTMLEVSQRWNPEPRQALPMLPHPHASLRDQSLGWLVHGRFGR
jgi:hypothetical protein